LIEELEEDCRCSKCVFKVTWLVNPWFKRFSSAKINSVCSHDGNLFFRCVLSVVRRWLGSGRLPVPSDVWGDSCSSHHQPGAWQDGLSRVIYRLFASTDLTDANLDFSRSLAPTLKQSEIVLPSDATKLSDDLYVAV
jgi:hypothetical protein